MSSSETDERGRCEFCDIFTDRVGVINVNGRIYLDTLCRACAYPDPMESARLVLDSGGPTHLLTAVERGAVSLDVARRALRRWRRGD